MSRFGVSFSTASLVCALVSLLAVSLTFSWPLFGGPWLASHEGQAYVARAIEFSHGWRSGVVYPRWCPDLYGGYGSPFFNFYAPLVFVLSSGFNLLVHDAALGLKLTGTLFGLVAAVGSFGLAYNETRRVDAALVGAMLFVAFPYRIADLYVRGDFAEYGALSLLTLALWAYRATALTPHPTRVALYAGLAALCHAATLLCHTLTGLWGTKWVVLLVSISAYQVWRLGDVRRVRALLLAFGFALLLSTTYILPALLEKRFVPVELMIRPSGHPANRWVFFHELIEHPFVAVGLPWLLALAAVPVVALVRRRARPALAWWAVSTIALVLCLSLATPIWKSGIIPFSSFIQFPWRLLGPAGIAASVAVAVAWAALLPPRAPSHGAAFAVAALVAVLAAPRARVQGYYAEWEVPKIAAGLHSTVESASGVDEYLPIGATRPQRPRRALLSERNDELGPVRAVGDGHHYELEVSAAGQTDFGLALHAFPGWKLETREGPAAATLAARAGLLRVHLPARGRYVLQLSMGESPVRRLANLVSVAALLLLVPTLVWSVHTRLELTA